MRTETANMLKLKQRYESLNNLYCELYNIETELKQGDYVVYTYDNTNRVSFGFVKKDLRVNVLLENFYDVYDRYYDYKINKGQIKGVYRNKARSLNVSIQ
jgi:hypothetical protein